MKILLPGVSALGQMVQLMRQWPLDKGHLFDSDEYTFREPFLSYLIEKDSDTLHNKSYERLLSIQKDLLII